MTPRLKTSPYDTDGRLADVIAAVTVLAAHRLSEGSIAMWARQLSRSEPDGAEGQRNEGHWQTVFEDHPEFFLVYRWEGEMKAALRLRYANKTIDRSTGQPHSRLTDLTAQERGELTSLPLDAAATNTLITIAISLHQAALARKADSRFFVQILGPSLIALLGVLLGAVVAGWMKTPAPPAAPLVVKVEGLSLQRLKEADVGPHGGTLNSDAPSVSHASPPSASR